MDEAPPHYYQQGRNFLNTSYPRRWIGKREPVAWPPRSPDLNAIDFFALSHFKVMVYEREYLNE